MRRTSTVATTSKKASHTRLVDKHYSPLVIRKITHYGFPIYVGLITDDDLSDLDDIILDYMETHKQEGWINNIQAVRDLAGGMVEYLVCRYSKAEGVAVIFYVDKLFVSSLHGDFMTHAACKSELFSLLQMSTGV